MEIPPDVLKFLGSLIAILALAGIALWLKLGPQPRIESPEEARIAADQAVSGFDPVEIGLDRNGRGAIMRDTAGRLLLLRPHGSHFAGRILTPLAKLSHDGEQLVIDTGERRYGAFTLALKDPSAWVRAFEAVKGQHHA